MPPSPQLTAFLRHHRTELEHAVLVYADRPLWSGFSLAGRAKSEAGIMRILNGLSDRTHLLPHNASANQVSLWREVVERFLISTLTVFLGGATATGWEGERAWYTSTWRHGRLFFTQVLNEIMADLAELETPEACIKYMIILTPPALWLRLDWPLPVLNVEYTPVPTFPSWFSSGPWEDWETLTAGLRRVGRMLNGALGNVPDRALRNELRRRLEHQEGILFGPAVGVWYLSIGVQQPFAAFLHEIAERIFELIGYEGPVLAMKCFEHYTADAIDDYIVRFDSHPSGTQPDKRCVAADTSLILTS
ncbi:hypothetical protein JCM10908_000133 [Rhodotorula pacifica]|uniref:uncharacterized protein n=1 Tax=Rhodotorula pacifica TaxID=1495444 RepID=UPI00316E2E84